MRELIKKDLENNDYCFGCGKDNPVGAKLEFYKISEDQVETEFLVPLEWSGWGKIVHGGLQAVILDEISAWTMISMLQVYGVTIKTTIEFLKPLYVQEKLKGVSRIIKKEEKNIWVESKLFNKNEELCTKSIFIFRMLDLEKIKKMARIDV
ncbi:MAG: PaaI family thioesterase [Candidatus Heimdallarchaeaceae archaeon]